MFKKIITITIFALLVANATTAAPAPFDPTDFSFVIHLYYDNGKLVFNRDAKLSYEVVGLSYVPEQISRTSPQPVLNYRGDVISVSGAVLSKFNFDPTKGNPSFKKGVVDVSAPYFTDAKSINLYDDKDQMVLAVDTMDTLICNGNNTCEADRGEDSLTCPIDCSTPTPTPVSTPSPTPVVPVGTDSTDWMLIAIIALLVIAIAGAATWFIIKRRREKVNDISITIPPSQ